jgi:ATP-dependent DNA helicase RecQ
MHFSEDDALRLLRAGSGRTQAQFREGQLQAIQHVVDAQGRLLVVQKTGWGKSFVYFIATKLLRQQGMGTALLISPLLSLMRNQIQAAERMGVKAATINSDNTEDWDSIATVIRNNEVDILLISPERLANEKFNTQVLSLIASNLSLLVIDEAHCISDWGHDFRPHYRLLERIVRGLPANIRLLATTATANNRVMEDLKQVLGPNMTALRGDLNRPSLHLQSIQMPSQAERMAWLAHQLKTLPGHGIIYTLSVRDAALISAWLDSQGIHAPAYTGQTGEQRAFLEQALLNNEVKALVATTALGMGFDKPDLAFVFHYQTPGSVVAYYQQVGRAGRGLSAAYGVLLSGTEDTEINNYFIQSAFPTKQEVDDILSVLASAPNGLTMSELMSELNISKGRIDKTLLLLSLESPSPIAKTGSKWQLTSTQLSTTFWDRAQRLTDLRRIEQLQMQSYVQLRQGHMRFLIQALDGDASDLSLNALSDLNPGTDSNLVLAALAFLKQTNLPFIPRKRWPAGGLPIEGLKGLSSIPSEFQAQPGKVLCRWGDAGWGPKVRQGKYAVGQFSDELVAACVTLISNWGPEPAPEWVTAVPSLRHPTLVPDFAKRLAQALRLPFKMVLVKSEHRPEQKTMANSIQQARNVDGSLCMNKEDMPDGAVLLVDDMVDSRWTITLASYLLRLHGCGPVWPIALAQTGHDSDDA